MRYVFADSMINCMVCAEHVLCGSGIAGCVVAYIAVTARPTPCPFRISSSTPPCACATDATWSETPTEKASRPRTAPVVQPSWPTDHHSAAGMTTPSAQVVAKAVAKVTPECDHSGCYRNHQDYGIMKRLLVWQQIVDWLLNIRDSCCMQERVANVTKVVAMESESTCKREVILEVTK